MECLLSIITISKNDPIGLERTLKSIQSLDSVERIVVLGDDNPQSLTIAQNANCTILRDSGEGISGAFNCGLAQANGIAVMFLNGGDVLAEPAMVQYTLELMAQNDQIDILLYDAIFEDALVGPYLYRARRTATAKLNRLGSGMPGSHQAMIFRRTCFKDLGGFNPTYHIAMDYEWLCRWQSLSAPNTTIRFVEFPPIVTVDGKGISVGREPLCLYECFLALRDNHLLKGQFCLDYLTRLLRFFLRYTMMNLGLSHIVAWIKRCRHQPV